jgi:hypothetical protein
MRNLQKKTLIDLQDSIDRLLYCSQSLFKHGDEGKNIIYVGIDTQFPPLSVNVYFGKSANNIFKYQVNNMGSTIAFYKETVVFQVTFWA